VTDDSRRALAWIKPVDFGKVASGQRLHDLEVVVVDAPVVRQPGHNQAKTRETAATQHQPITLLQPAAQK
jgi:hypothetical protein